jgi:all-trans-retinol 13,14-reductase
VKKYTFKQYKGGSGLVAANMMSRAGLKVLVLERHYIVGGCTHTWEENGYEWDTGVHYVGESISHESSKSTGRVLKFLTDGKLKWETMDDVYDIVKLRNNSSGEINAYPIEKRRVKDGQKWDTLEAMLKKEFPEEHEAIDKFIETIFGCSKSSLALGMYKVLPRPLLNFLIKLGLHDRIFDNYQLTQNTREFLDSITNNPKLKCVMNYCFGDFGTNPNKAPLFMNSALFRTFMDGGFFPTGGSSEMTKTLAEPIWARGGKVLVRADVKEICVANGLA